MKTWIFIVLVAVLGGLTAEQKPESPPPIEADFSKVAIENSAERLVESTRIDPREEFAVESSQDARLDVSKGAIESSAESLVKTSRTPEPRFGKAASNLPPPPQAPPTVVSVKPGLVSWHQDYVTARAASQVSGKPILLFQLLGNLDEHFT